MQLPKGSTEVALIYRSNFRRFISRQNCKSSGENLQRKHLVRSNKATRERNKLRCCVNALLANNLSLGEGLPPGSKSFALCQELRSAAQLLAKRRRWWQSASLHPGLFQSCLAQTVVRGTWKGGRPERQRSLQTQAEHLALPKGPLPGQMSSYL